MSAGVLSLENLTVGYSGRALVESINAEVALGRFIAVLGANGVGKSTLLRTLTGAIPPLSGNLFFIEDGRKSSFHALTVRQQSAVVSAVYPLRGELPVLPVTAYVAMGQYRFSDWLGRTSAAEDEQTRQILADMKILELADRNVCELSDGEFQRVEIARALAQKTPVMVLDEPTSHLDYWARREIMELLRQIAHTENVAIVVCTHEIDLATQYCDEFWLMKRGGTFEHTEKLEEEKIGDLFVTQIINS